MCLTHLIPPVTVFSQALVNSYQGSEEGDEWQIVVKQLSKGQILPLVFTTLDFYYELYSGTSRDIPGAFQIKYDNLPMEVENQNEVNFIISGWDKIYTTELRVYEERARQKGRRHGN